MGIGLYERLFRHPALCPYHLKQQFSLLIMYNLIMNIMWLQQQPQMLQLTKVLRCAEGGVESGGVDVGVAQNISQVTQILGLVVIQAGEQVAQIVGKHLLRFHLSQGAKCFHFMENIAPVQGAAGMGDENTAGSDPLTFCIPAQQAAQLPGQQHSAVFSLQTHSGTALPHCFHRNKPQLTDSDSSGADGLQQQPQPLLPCFLSRTEQAVILLTGQLPFPEGTGLDLQALNGAVSPAQPF